MPPFFNRLFTKENHSRAIVSASTSAKIIRADGTVVDLGVVSFYHRSLWRRMAWRISQWVRGRRAGTVTVKTGETT